MATQEKIQYHRVAEAIQYLKDHFKAQPGLFDVADHVHVSSTHFQRIFTSWAGTSPKKFLQYISIEYAKKLLRDNQLSLAETAFETGLSGTGRLHDLFMTIEGMTPGEYKNGGECLHINYSLAESPFGTILIASTAKGICTLTFAAEEDEAVARLKQKFPNATYHQKLDVMQQNALFIFTQDWKKLEKIKLHLKGTGFQLKVWEALLKIPFGGLSTYGDVSQTIQNPKATRAVGTAVGDNPVAFLIPCHRVIQSTGVIGQYHWGSLRKTAMIGWEAAKLHDAPSQGAV